MKEKLNKRYNDYINELRIKSIVIEIENQGLENLSIEGIAYNYGFSSKSTFYRAFKKHKGCTPSEYIEKINLKSS